MCSANILCTGADNAWQWMAIDELTYLQGTVGILICISVNMFSVDGCGVPRKCYVIFLPLYIISPTCKSLNTLSSYANNLPYKVQGEQ